MRVNPTTALVFQSYPPPPLIPLILPSYIELMSMTFKLEPFQGLQLSSYSFQVSSHLATYFKYPTTQFIFPSCFIVFQTSALPRSLSNLHGPPIFLVITSEGSYCQLSQVCGASLSHFQRIMSKKSQTILYMRISLRTAMQ